MKNLKKLSIMVVAVAMLVLPVLASRAAAASIDIPTTTLYIHKLGDLTLVVKEGVPETIVVKGRNLSGMGVYFTVNGAPYTGDVLLTNNLILQAGTMPLTFDHYGVVEFTVGDHMLVLKYNGTATKTKDLAMMTKTLYTKGDFIVEQATGAFAGLNGLKGTFKLNQVCRIVPGHHPMVGSPVEVTFSAMSGM